MIYLKVYPGEMRVLFQKMRAIREENTKEIEAVLIPEQVKAYNTMLEDMRNRLQ